jgi:hypothetical protein
MLLCDFVKITEQEVMFNVLLFNTTIAFDFLDKVKFVTIYHHNASIYLLITIHKDLDAISSILYQVFEITPFKRDYDTAFGKIAEIIRRYGVIENPRNLRFRFTLCMQEFFDSIPQEQWKLKDPAFIKQSEVFAISKFKEWIIEQIT